MPHVAKGFEKSKKEKTKKTSLTRPSCFIYIQIYFSFNINSNKDLFKMPLRMWRELTPLDEPLRKPTAASPHILVIGGGVTGLITSWVLLDRGYRVTVLSS
jgi:heterodisulfide reductase subunit A-like polyferredoxin